MNFLDGVFEKKNPTIPNLMKIRPLGTELLQKLTDLRYEMTNLTVGLRNFANAPKNMTPNVPIMSTAILGEITSLFRGEGGRPRSAPSVIFSLFIHMAG